MIMWLGFALVLGFGLFGFAGSSAIGGGSDSTNRTRSAAGERPIDALKQQYVSGELDIDAFERRAKRLYETEQAVPSGESLARGSTGTAAKQTGSTVEASNETHGARRPKRRGRGGCRR